MLFFLALFFNPIFASVPPWSTGPALIIVGGLMMESVTKVNWSEMRQAMPAFVSIVMMPFTYSIAYGIIGGLVLNFVIVAVDKVVHCLRWRCSMCRKMGCCPLEEEVVDPQYKGIEFGK